MAGSLVDIAQVAMVRMSCEALERREEETLVSIVHALGLIGTIVASAEQNICTIGDRRLDLAKWHGHMNCSI